MGTIYSLSNANHEVVYVGAEHHSDSLYQINEMMKDEMRDPSGLRPLLVKFLREGGKQRLYFDPLDDGHHFSEVDKYWFPLIVEHARQRPLLNEDNNPYAEEVTKTLEHFKISVPTLFQSPTNSIYIRHYLRLIKQKPR